MTDGEIHFLPENLDKSGETRHNDTKNCAGREAKPVRVITGSARGMRLRSPEGRDVRPTGEKTKEAVFSILQNEIEGAEVLDLFAGSGQLGIEALSRGAAHCMFVERDRKIAAFVRENLSHTRLEERAGLYQGDCMAFLGIPCGPFDIALLDPPYRQGLLDKALPLVAKAMRPGGVIVCETAADEDPPDAAGDFHRVREYRYGKTKITLYRQDGEAVS